RTRENDGSKYGDTKWRYMLIDTEYSMDLYGCDSGMGNVIERTRQNDRLFNAVCNNIGFQQKLANTLMDLANRNFEPVSASAKLDTLAVKYRPLMEQYFARFSGDLGTFDNRIERLKRYVQERKAVIQGFLRDSFGI
ncbi:MAG: CotH kinase family protein, partial [Lachnospiraceae bacterium]|nr:CotH kinase family protein [Lachnospiraceae bacterium]